MKIQIFIIVAGATDYQFHMSSFNILTEME